MTIRPCSGHMFGKSLQPKCGVTRTKQSRLAAGKAVEVSAVHNPFSWGLGFGAWWCWTWAKGHTSPPMGSPTSELGWCTSAVHRDAQLHGRHTLSSTAYPAEALAWHQALRKLPERAPAAKVSRPAAPARSLQVTASLTFSCSTTCLLVNQAFREAAVAGIPLKPGRATSPSHCCARA